MSLTHFSLFTGIGDLDLAAEMAGFTTVGQCEFADYPTKVLEKHWPNVPRWRDVRDVTRDSVRKRTGGDKITVVSGGFPCQPFSIAGEKRGTDDERYLWPEMCRIISQLKPTWVLGENVANFVNMALEQTCIDLESSGYEVQPVIIPACAVNAPHQRKRVFIIGHISDTECNGHQGLERLQQDVRTIEERRASALRAVTKLFDDVDWKKRAVESGFLGGNNGILNRVDRLKCLGNAVVPQQAYPIFKAIAEIERS
ncbi:modification methylase HaeIII [Desulfosporosinus acididurans]|uniref:DNA (cytosine-5-)-methyltransferase n=1 Tax=Desulfosporosinus acididurans TaxID=476652 RepID=A0A0J1FTL2_9FIRM|nr:DNA (cytosine-5-)-methyltransferase [Desulfosporosinus acididurans]KLU66333.1 modification methylase HaeIII [Desulfosporosinus acididurans]